MARLAAPRYVVPSPEDWDGSTVLSRLAPTTRPQTQQVKKRRRFEKEERDDGCLLWISLSMPSPQSNPSIHAEQDVLYSVPGLWPRAAVFLGGDAPAETCGVCE
jgi:hypothetical protein